MYICIHVYMYMYICIYVYMYICIYVYMYTQYCTYKYTGIHNLYIYIDKHYVHMLGAGHCEHGESEKEGRVGLCWAQLQSEH